MNSKGVSAVVTSVLLVLGVIVFSGVIWFVVQGLISSSQEDISSGVNLLNLKISNVYVEEGNLIVEISRKVGRGSLNSINFVLETGTDNEIIKQETNLKELENYKFVLSLTKVNPAEINKVSIAPDSEEVVDVWETEERGLNCVPACTGKICGDDGCGGVCNNGAETITCTAIIGTCTPSGTKTCSADGTDYGDCVATIDPRIATCAGKQCGSDGCGGVCGTCLSTQDCSATGLCLNKLRIFVTRSTTTGNLKGTFLDGIAGADNKCIIDLSNPNPSGNWKALIGSTSPLRQVGTNWVLQANRNYYTIDRTKLIGTTNANGWFTFPLNNAINATSYSLWTGLGGTGINSGSNCISWTNVGSVGTRGVSSLTSNGSVSLSGAVTCSTTIFRLYCVEQDS